MFPFTETDFQSHSIDWYNRLFLEISLSVHHLPEFGRKAGYFRKS